jgi:hypothetical protein
MLLLLLMLMVLGVVVAGSSCQVCAWRRWWI